MPSYKPYYIFFAGKHSIEEDDFTIRYISTSFSCTENVPQHLRDHLPLYLPSIDYLTVHAFVVLTRDEYHNLVQIYTEDEIEIPTYVESLEDFLSIFNPIRTQDEHTAEFHQIS